MKNKLLFMLKKELREVFRDRKSLLMMLIIPFMIPAVVIGISYLFDAEMNSTENKYNKIGFAYEITDIEKEIANGMEIDYKIGSVSKMKKLYEEDVIDLYIIKKDNQYIINYDENNQDSSTTVMLAESFLNQYKTVLQNNYLTNNNINSDDVLNIINIDYKTIGEKEDNYFANYIVNYAFIFIIMAITVSATYPATDATAGEKERGTLETLLTFPVRSKDIILGKFLSVSISSIITGVLGFILALISLWFVNDKVKIYEGINLIPSLETNIITILIIILYSILISGLCIAIASKAKSFKEAQSALSPITMISCFPGLIAFMLELKTTNILAAIPFINYVQIFCDVNSGNINYLHITLMFATTIIFIGIVMFYIIKSYNNEKVLFN